MNEYEKLYLNDEIRDSLMKNAIIVFDTSALLDLYFYSESTLNEIINNVFKKLKGRLWLPYQVKFEFLKNKEKVEKKPIGSYENLMSKPKDGNGGYISKIVELSNEYEKNHKSIKNQLKTLKEQTLSDKKHPFFESNQYSEIDFAVAEFEKSLGIFKENIQQFQNNIEESIQKKIEMIKSKAFDGIILDAINNCFDIGSDYTYDELISIAKEGCFRYENNIPPGYADLKEKIGLPVFGDLIIWKQILDYSSKQNQSLIFVSNDVKEDWLEAERMPRFELLKEYNSTTNNYFWMYNISDFLYEYNKILDHAGQLNESTLKEVRSYEIERRPPVDYEKFFLQYIANDYISIDEIELEEEIDIVNAHKFKAFVATESNEEETYILTYALSAVNYTSVLHPLRNIQKVKKHFDSIELKYKYILYYFCDDLEFLEKCLIHINKKNTRKIYNNPNFEVRFVVIKDGKLCHITTNK